MVGETALDKEAANAPDQQAAVTDENNPAHGSAEHRELIEQRQRVKELEFELARLKKTELAGATVDAEQTLQKSNLSEADLAKIKEYAAYSARMKAANEVLIAVGQPPFLIQPPPIFGPIPANAPIDIDLTGIGDPEDKVRAHQKARAIEESVHSSTHSGDPSAKRAKKAAHAKQGARKRSPTPPRQDAQYRPVAKSDAPRDAATQKKARIKASGHEKDYDEVRTSDTHKEMYEKKLEDLQRAVQNLEKSKGEGEKEPHAAMGALSESLLADLPEQKMSHVNLTDYSGTTDPYDWLSSFQSRMMLATRHRSAWCVAMVGCMKDKASAWLRKLPAGSIRSWEDMQSKFLTEFKTAHRPSKTANDLFLVKQGADETSGAFHQRFVQTYDQTRDVDDKTAVMAFQTGLAKGELKTHLTLHPPDTFTSMLEQARKYATVEPDHQRARSGNMPSQTDFATSSSSPQGSRRRDERELKKPMIFDPKDYIPLNSRPSEILNEIRDHVPKPPKLKSDLAERRDKGYCEFHCDYGHDTDDCRNLLSLINRLIKEGKLSHFKKVENNATRGGAPRYDRELA